MQRFDCLAPDLQLFGPHFLEASAGTGKTFAIEQIVARLVKSGVDLEQILVVTFTNAATRELRRRIRTNLERCGVRTSFERNQIFTIHGFCSRMLKEFAFEANVLPGTEDASLQNALRDFLETGLDCISPAQLRIVGPVEELVKKLKKGEMPVSSKTFQQRCSEFQYDVPEELSFNPESYKKMDGDFEDQLDALRHKDLERLIAAEHSIYEFTARVNRNFKAMPPFFDWGRDTVWPMIQEARDPKGILDTLLSAWKPLEEKALEGTWGPDQLLKMMRAAVQLEPFKHKVQKKYRAVLIDEFQDTDPIQWEIFETLFLKAEALYLIGDPKQSIYRFRKADLYTYLKAKEAVGHSYYLDTNYRSSKELIGTLNRLFDRDWLHLPKQKRVLPYHPVRAGLDLSSDFKDNKGAVHCLQIEEKDLYNYVAREIELLPKTSIAVLVKDRYQAQEVQKALTVPCVARTHEVVLMEEVYELFEALHAPFDSNKAKIAASGPFVLEDIPRLRQILDEKGLAALFREIEVPPTFGQVLELLFEWEREHGFSFPGIFRFIESIEQMDPEDAPKVRKEVEENAVQIMTMHMSKGLEFDVVFALGVSAPSPQVDEEVEAEKLRQLYVALTRAKRRLYIPLIENRRSGRTSPMDLFQVDWKELSQETSLTMETVQGPIVVPKREVDVKPENIPVLVVPKYDPSFILSFTAISKEKLVETLEPIPEPNGIYTPQNLPRGAETGVIVHKIFERVFSGTELITAVTEEMGPLTPWKEVLVQMVQETMALPLISEIKEARVETEFLFEDGNNFMKGFIDLLFIHEGKLYFVDWKTNWLSDYSEENLRESMTSHQYDLQASIYREALKRQWPGEIYGVYVFVRGPKAIWI